jgi:hypothetical protein
LSELVLLPNTYSFQQFEDFFIVEGGQYLVEVEQALTKSSNC